MAKILIGCEESQVVTKAFRDRGHEAYSCDLQETRGNTDWHIQEDIFQLLGWTQMYKYDLIILHPPCTKLAVSGNRWYGKGTKKHYQRQDALEWTTDLWRLAKAKAKHIALENPVGVLWPFIGKPQYIQPWQFGHGETKKTGLALHNLPPLEPTNIVEGREQRIWRMPPSETRARDRSETYSGIAAAMADQWGNLEEINQERK